ncbi:MAG: hypothetical protein R3F23_01945 [Verrucomicrobiia bacterium]
MSFNEMVAELPKLSPEERQKLAILALEWDSEDIAFCHEAARQSFSLLDHLEAQDAGKTSNR